MYIEELERKVNHLSSDNDNLLRQVASLTEDKKKLQEDLLYLQSIINQSPNLSQQYIPAKNMKAAGLCLLIVLFSFGLLFNANNSNFPSKIGKLNDERNPEINTAGSNWDSSVHSGRTLKSVEEAAEPKKIVVGADVKLLPETENKHILSLQMKDKKIKREETLSSNPKKKMKIADGDGEVIALPKDLVPLQHGQISTGNNRAADITISNNMTYIICPEATEISPSQPADPNIIALLIPSTMLNTTQEMEPSLLEVQCQVLNLHIWPSTTVNP